MEVRINNLLAKVLIVEPPTGIVGIVEPPSGLVLTLGDGLTISLESESEKDKDGACTANVLVLGSVYMRGFPLNQDQVSKLIFVLIAYILGTAIEDNGRKDAVAQVEEGLQDG